MAYTLVSWIIRGSPSSAAFDSEIFHFRIVRSELAVNTTAWAWEDADQSTAIPSIPRECPLSVCNKFGFLLFLWDQTFNRASVDPDNSNSSDGTKVRDLTKSLCPSKVNRHSRVYVNQILAYFTSIFHTLMVLSHEPVYKTPTLRATEVTGPVCPRNVCPISLVSL